METSLHQPSAFGPRSFAYIGCIALCAMLGAGTAVSAQPEPANRHHDAQSALSAKNAGNSPLIDKVRAATARFADVQVARDEGWVQGTPCVSGPASGAMGIHYILPSRVGDGALNASEPEALIYEPRPDGTLRLVGVEYIVIAEDWANLHPQGGTPAVDGHLTHYVGAPNRYGLPAFYEMHVWAWETNPSGSFADFNTHVSCEQQPGS